MAKLNWDRENKRKRMVRGFRSDIPEISHHEAKYKLLFAEAKARAEKKRMEEFLAKKVRREDA